MAGKYEENKSYLLDPNNYNSTSFSLTNVTSLDAEQSVF